MEFWLKNVISIFDIDTLEARKWQIGVTNMSGSKTDNARWETDNFARRK